MGSKENIIHKWTEPAEARIHEAKKLWKRAKVGIPCILVIVLVIEVVLYFAITNLVPQEIQREMELSWFKLFRISFIGCAGMTCLLYLVIIGGTRFFASRYEMTETGIRAIGQSSWVLLWEQVNAYSIFQHEDLPSVTKIRLCTPKTSKCFSLAQNEESEQIIRAIKSKVLVRDEPHITFEEPNLSRGQWLFMFVLTLPYIGLVTLFPILIRYGAWLGMVLTVLPLFAGPGFVGFRLLFGKEWSSNPRLRGYAIAINLATFMLVFLWVFVLGFYILSRQFYSFYS